MKVTVLGHACLYIEHKNVRLLIDPWLTGSCYWRSWWNYPEPPAEILQSLEPTHIYITHLHWDHYHGATLRYFHKDDPVILLPKCPTTRMADDMRRDFRFSRIRELVHARQYALADDFKVYSYQFNPVFIDSSLVIEAGDTTILNANDSKVFGLSFHQIINSHKRFNFVFRSHSSASPDPYCVEGVNPWETSRNPKEYAKDFLAFAKTSRAKYAIPFASSHVYLHKDTARFNEFYNSPLNVLREHEKDPNPSFQCILMPPGSSWSELEGFTLCDHDYTLINSDIKALADKHQESLEKSYKRSRSSSFNEGSFRRYFTAFAKCLHFPIKPLRFAFFISPEIEGPAIGDLAIVSTRRQSIDCVSNVSYSSELLKAHNLSFILRVSPVVVNDCTAKKMFNTFSASKLLRIHPRGEEVDYKRFFTLVDLYENDGLPLWRIFESRQLINRLRRFREFLDLFWYVYIVRIRKASLSNVWAGEQKRLHP